MSKQLRVPGHTLRSSGFVYTFVKGYVSRTWVGCARCSCGAESPVLRSDYARKRWHREHKLDVSAALAGDDEHEAQGVLDALREEG